MDGNALKHCKTANRGYVPWNFWKTVKPHRLFASHLTGPDMFDMSARGDSFAAKGFRSALGSSFGNARCRRTGLRHFTERCLKLFEIIALGERLIIYHFCNKILKESRYVENFLAEEEGLDLLLSAQAWTFFIFLHVSLAWIMLCWTGDADLESFQVDWAGTPRVTRRAESCTAHL